MPVLLFLVLPLLTLLLNVSPEWLLGSLVQPSISQAIGLSLTTTAVSVVVTVVLGTPLAYLMARRRFAGQSLLDTVIDLPLVLPPAAAGIALLLTFGSTGLVGQHLASAGIRIPFTPLAVVIAQTFVAAPFYIKSAMSGLGAFDVAVEEAARIDGAASWQVFRYVTVPLARNAMLGGAVMTWARALGEFGATIIFAGNFPGRTQTMPIAIYIGFNLNFQSAVSLAAILLLVSFGVLLVVKWVLRQHVTRADIY